MTYREKLINEHPELDHEIILRTACPSEYMDAACHPKCGAGLNEFVCDKCWDQEVPETVREKDNISCDTCTHEKVCKFRDDFNKSLKILKDIPDGFEVIVRCKHYL